VSSTTVISPEENRSWLDTLVAVFPFASFGLVLILNELPREWTIPSLVHSASGYLFIGTIAVLPIGYCIGWIQSFPKWSYPYVGQFLLFSLYLMGQPALSFMEGKSLLGWRAWIPFAVITIILLLIPHTRHSGKSFFTNIRNDWTLLTFCMFGFMPLIVAVIFDEMGRLYSLYFMIILTLLMVGTVIAYMQSSTRKVQVSVLAIGVFLTVAIAVFGPSWYWFNKMGTAFSPTLIAGLIVYVVMSLPLLIGKFRKPDKVI